MRYQQLTEFYNEAGSTTKRLEKIAILAKFLKHLDEKDADTLSELLDLQDNELWDIVSGRSDRFDERFEGIVARLRAV